MGHLHASALVTVRLDLLQFGTWFASDVPASAPCLPTSACVSWLTLELLPVSRTRSLGVIVKPEVAYGEAEFQS